MRVSGLEFEVLGSFKLLEFGVLGFRGFGVWG